MCCMIAGTSPRMNAAYMSRRQRPGCGRNYERHNLREPNDSILCGEIKLLIYGFRGQALPAIDFSHVDLSGSKQCPEQHGGGVCRWHGLRLDPALERLVEPFDRVCSARATPLAWRQTCEGEEPIAGFLQAVGDGFVFEPPLADEGLAVLFDLFGRFRVDHFVVVVSDFLMQALRGVREEIPVLMNRASLHR